MKKVIALLAACLCLGGCDVRQGHHRHKKEVVRSYRIRSHTQDDTWIYYYVFLDAATKNYYYASSATPIPTVNYGTISWIKADQRPAELDEKGIEEMEQAEVDTADLGEAGAEITDSLDSMEGVPDSSDTSSADSSSDSGSSDGGGDGGGGGD